MRIPAGLLLFTVLGLASAAPRTEAQASHGPARRPGDWISALTWVQPDSLGPTDMADRIVLVEFWTFGCINCTRTIPAMRVLHETLGDQVLVVGIHSPEFSHEKSRANVRKAIARHAIRYAVAQDNSFVAWRAFDNHYWPAIYLLDRKGRIRHVHIGELHPNTPRWDRLIEAIESVRGEAASTR